MESRACPIFLLWLVAPLCCTANEESSGCRRAEVEAHVTRQFEIYGPLSIGHEYFAFVYRFNGSIGSAVIRGRSCPDSRSCGVNSAAAASAIPRGAKVLGEWHTHPKGGSTTLSADDVRGAYNNRHIRCYVAFYSKPNGEIYAWDPDKTSVPTAMASRKLVGNFVAKLAEPADEAVRYTDDDH